MPSVAVLAVPKLTVISDPETIELVAVKVSDEPAFSAILVALTASVTVGADSFSVIVIVTACVPFSAASAPDTPSIEIIAVSLVDVSYMLSSVGVKVVVPVVAPALIVMSETVP